jgi:hypothetical protein
MKTKIFIYIIVMPLIYSCKSSKEAMSIGGKDMRSIAIQNAINDFSMKCRLFKNDSIFSVSFEDSVFDKPTFIRINERMSTWKRGVYCSDIVAVTISAHRINDCDWCCDKFLYTNETKVGSIGKLPSRHIVIDGKLFYWYDDNYPLTEEMLAVLWKYNLLCDDREGKIGIPDFSTDDSQKGADYYFCKNNLSHYKRVITNRAIGYYAPPKLKCR